MYVPAHFAPDAALVGELLRNHGAADLVTVTERGLVATMLPFVYVPPSDPAAAGPRSAGQHRSPEQHRSAGQHGALHGHLARNNDQWKLSAAGESLAIVRGPDAYISPGWYAAKAEHGRVVPTWNYVTVHAYGLVEFFEDADRLLDVVTRLTDLHEGPRSGPWAVTDAPADFIQAQLRGIVGVRMAITRIEGKRKMSQNRPEADRAGVAVGLAASDREDERAVSRLIPR